MSKEDDLLRHFERRAIRNPDQVSVPLTYPLPQAEWYQLPNGLWSTRAWTAKSRAIAERGRYKLVPRKG